MGLCDQFPSFDPLGGSMVLRLIFVGGVSELYRELEEYYLTRLKSILKTELLEVPESKAASPKRRLQEEAIRIRKLLKGNVYVTDARGTLINDDFMLWLVKSSMYDDISIVVGGPYGVASEVGGERISFSKLTFPHDLFRIMLLEQLYRQALALRGVKYKK
ncbi:MAG TPA: hypothetical protein ENF26_02050 [Methanomicrobia archaeon]|nr:hypothetical protein [Methanomicrobia archaeon]HEX58916.1 hypothetical protein [Methanomicrobia archaeon]